MTTEGLSQNSSTSMTKAMWSVPNFWILCWVEHHQRTSVLSIPELLLLSHCNNKEFNLNWEELLLHELDVLKVSNAGTSFVWDKNNSALDLFVAPAEYNSKYFAIYSENVVKSKKLCCFKKIKNVKILEFGFIAKRIFIYLIHYFCWTQNLYVMFWKSKIYSLLMTIRSLKYIKLVLLAFLC